MMPNYTAKNKNTKPNKNHPWKKDKIYSGCPADIKEISAYVAVRTGDIIKKKMHKDR